MTRECICLIGYNAIRICLFLTALDECKAKTANCQLIGSQATCVSPPSTVQTYWSACAGKYGFKAITPFTSVSHPAENWLVERHQLSSSSCIFLTLFNMPSWQVHLIINCLNSLLPVAHDTLLYFKAHTMISKLGWLGLLK